MDRQLVRFYDCHLGFRLGTSPQSHALAYYYSTTCTLPGVVCMPSAVHSAGNAGADSTAPALSGEKHHLYTDAAEVPQGL